MSTHLNEKRERGRFTDYLINPTRDELIGLFNKSPFKSLRFLHNERNDDLYVWEAMNSTHDSFLRNELMGYDPLNFGDGYIYVSDTKNNASYLQHGWKKHEKLIRALLDHIVKVTPKYSSYDITNKDDVNFTMNENRKSNITPFSTYLSEAGRSRGEAMEHAIVTAINGKEEEQPGIPFGAGTKVAEKTKLKGVKAEVLGTSTIGVSDLWSQYWPGGKVPSGTKTPKTDFIAGRKRISLKTGSDAQLMSGGRNESIATFYAAVDRMGVDPAKKGGLYEKIEKAILDLAPASIAQSGLATEIQKGQDQAVMRANAAHKILQRDIANLFANDPNFAYEFCYEAMTGEVKFGEKSPACCDHFLTCEFDGENAHLIPTSSTSYVQAIAGRTKVSVRFKTTSEKVRVDGKTVKSGRYRYWSVVGLVTDKLTEEVNRAGEYLTESVISKIITRVKTFAIQLLRRVLDFIKKSFRNLLEFLGIEPDIRFNNTPGFAP